MGVFDGGEGQSELYPNLIAALSVPVVQRDDVLNLYTVFCSLHATSDGVRQERTHVLLMRSCLSLAPLPDICSN